MTSTSMRSAPASRPAGRAAPVRRKASPKATPVPAARAKRASSPRPARPPTLGEAGLANEAVRQVVRGMAEGIDEIAKANRAARPAPAKRAARHR